MISLLALLLVAATGAWAQEETLLTTILSTGDNASFTSGSKTFDNIATVSFSDEVINDDDEYGWFSGEERTLTVTAAEGCTITRVKFYTDSGSAFDEEAPFEAIVVHDGKNIAKVNGTSIGQYGVTKIEVYGYAAPAAENVTNIIFNNLGLANAYDLTSGPLTVGNIELNFDKADGNNPPAFYTTGGGAARIYKGNTMSIYAGGATITKIVFNLTQGTPTFNTGSYNATTSTWEGEATTLTLSNEMASGQVRITSMDVYYSVASAAGEATYTVTLKEGTEDADKWTIAPAEATTTGVAQGTEITATYSGTKLVKSVKATKKVAGPTAYTLAESTQGMIVGTDGKAYDVADKDNLPTGVTAAGVVVYKDGANGLAIALTDEASTMDWATACGENGAAAHTPAVEGLTWKLPSQEEWTLVGNANSGSSLNSAITSAGGTAIPTTHFDPETMTMTGQYWLLKFPTLRKSQ